MPKRYWLQAKHYLRSENGPRIVHNRGDVVEVPDDYPPTKDMVLTCQTDANGVWQPVQVFLGMSHANGKNFPVYGPPGPTEVNWRNPDTTSPDERRRQHQQLADMVRDEIRAQLGAK